MVSQPRPATPGGGEGGAVVFFCFFGAGEGGAGLSCTAGTILTSQQLLLVTDRQGMQTGSVTGLPCLCPVSAPTTSWF
jgi:hypothetical protein